MTVFKNNRFNIHFFKKNQVHFHSIHIITYNRSDCLLCFYIKYAFTDETIMSNSSQQRMFLFLFILDKVLVAMTLRAAMGNENI